MSSPMRLLLIDLDDTLFDTAGTLVPAAHADAVAAMVGAGLPGPVDARRAELQAILATTPHPDRAYAELARRHQAADAAVAAGVAAFFVRDVPPIEPFPGVREALAAFAGQWHRVLVTGGDPATQQRKVDRLGLAPLLDAVHLVGPDDAGGKGAAFARAMADTGCAADATVVVGNRADDEIAAGNRLGCVTVLVRGGEYANWQPRGPEHQPTHTVERFDQLPALLNSRFPDR